MEVFRKDVNRKRNKALAGSRLLIEQEGRKHLLEGKVLQLELLITGHFMKSDHVLFNFFLCLQDMADNLLAIHRIHHHYSVREQSVSVIVQTVSHTSVFVPEFLRLISLLLIGR